MAELHQPRRERLQPAADSRLQLLLHGPIGAVLLRLSAPNVAVVALWTLVAAADAYYVGQLGTTALAALALVFPLQSMMQMMSGGAIGGGVSSAVARAMGARDAARVSALPLHALVIAVAMATVYTLVGAVFGRQLFTALGATGPVLDGAVAYANVAFGGALAMWAANVAAALLRGTGNMVVPSRALVIGGVSQILLSGALTLGWLGLPTLGIVGPAAALICAQLTAFVLMLPALLGPGCAVQLRLRGVALRWSLFIDILKVGAVACLNSVLLIGTVMLVTALVASQGTAALAGYGLGSRLEILLVPMAFGVGAALTAAVGVNFGARQYARARRFALIGALAAAAVTGSVGLAVAVHPPLWLAHFSAQPEVLAMGAEYLRWVGPGYAFFGFGMALYFATQGTGKMHLAIGASAVRLAVAAGGGALALNVLGTGPVGLFAAVGASLTVFGSLLGLSLLTRVWRPDGR